MGDVLSFVTSRRAPKTMKLRDEGQKAVKAVKADPERGIEGKPAQEARKAWPEGSAVIVKTKIDSGDRADITEITMSSHYELGTTGDQELKTEFRLHRASLATTAVMVVGFEGPAFIDPDTGSVLEMNGVLEDRLATVRRLPPEVVAFVDAEVGRRTADPLEAN